MRRLFKVGADRHERSKVTFRWHPDGIFIASAGKNGVVFVTDRHGEIIDEVVLQYNYPVLSLEWDKDGENLAILQDGNSIIQIWNLSSRKTFSLDTSFKDLSFALWSKTSCQLAVGNSKGNLLIYNHSTKRKIPIIGKHSKKISCGCWSEAGNKLILGSDDKSVTLSDENGDLLSQIEFKNIPVETVLVSNDNKHSGPSTSIDNMLIISLDGLSVALCNLNDDKDPPLELSFGKTIDAKKGNKGKYGEIKHIEKVNDDLLLVGFSSGYLLTVPIDAKGLGIEQNVGNFQNNSMITFSYNTQCQIVATAGLDGIRIIDVKDFKESRSEHIPLAELENGNITSVQWSPDGQILTVATNSGNLYNFLAKMNILHATYHSSVAYLSSLKEVSVLNIASSDYLINISVEIEPSFLALGNNVIAAGMNNKVYYYSFSLPEMSDKRESKSNDAVIQLISDQEYAGTVKDIKVNSNHAVALFDSKATLHEISSDSSKSNPVNNSITFPTREEGLYSRISCIALTDDFLYYGTDGGTVEIFYISEWKLLPGSELRLDNGIKKIYPNGTGTRAVIIDSQNQTFLYNPVMGGGINRSVIQFTQCAQNVTNVIWDSGDENVILLFDGKFIHTYIYNQNTMHGTRLVKLGSITIGKDGSIVTEPNKFEILNGNIPITSLNGVLACQTASGNIVSLNHPCFNKLNAQGDPFATHKSIKQFCDADVNDEALQERFCQAIALNKLEIAWKSAWILGRRDLWLALGGKAVESLNMELAIRVYQQLGDAGMVLSLQSLEQIEDRLLLSGHIALIFNDYDKAQELFLLSSYPEAALQMRRDLLDWEQALKLAKALASPQLCDICVYYGQNMEHKTEVETALKYYESSLEEQTVNGKILPACNGDMRIVASSGVARCSLKLGNIRQGIKIAMEVGVNSLFSECGDILEDQKQYQEAADMHIKANEYERAAFIYTKHIIRLDKNKISEAAKILERVKNDQLNIAFAKACFAAGRYQEAMEAYKRAKDNDKVVELKLRYLNQIQEAFDIVRTCPTEISAQLVADYCAEISNTKGSIEFLLLANKNEDAFKLSQSHSLMDAYTELLGDHIMPEDALRVAQYYEKMQNYSLAGKFYTTCNQYNKALVLFLQCGDKEIDSAIDVVGKSQNDALTHQLIDFLVGEIDGVPKDANYIYKLYIALKKYEDASKTAIIISDQEQEIGNYQLAHSVIFDATSYLENAKVKVPQLLRQKFVLIHSYLLVKSLVRLGNHNAAARLLLRVGSQISKFPQHIVPILTSAVIECQRANMRLSSYEFAVTLMKPEYRTLIDPNIKRKIEAIVRRKISQNEEAEDNLSPCPICNNDMPDYCLECTSSKETVPMCVVSGRHMILDDWCFCPNSKAPALYSEYIKYIANHTEHDNAESTGDYETSDSKSNVLRNSGIIPLDPVLNKSVHADQIRKVTVEEAKLYIKMYNNVIDEEKKTNGSKSEKEDNQGKSDEIDKQDQPISNSPKTNHSKSHHTRFKTKRVNIGRSK